MISGKNNRGMVAVVISCNASSFVGSATEVAVTVTESEVNGTTLGGMSTLTVTSWYSPGINGPTTPGPVVIQELPLKDSVKLSPFEVIPGVRDPHRVVNCRSRSPTLRRRISRDFHPCSWRDNGHGHRNGDIAMLCVIREDMQLSTVYPGLRDHTGVEQGNPRYSSIRG